MITEVKENYCGYEIHTDEGYSYKIDTTYLSEKQLYLTISMKPEEGDNAWSTLHMSQIYGMVTDDVVEWSETTVMNTMVPKDVRDCVERILKTRCLR